MPAGHQALLDRFVAACQADDRIVAAFLVGSHAAGGADEHSDIDLFVVVSDSARESFLAGQAEFVRRLGDPVFLEDFGLATTVFFVMADGIEGELGVAPEAEAVRVLTGHRRLLLDKGGTFAANAATPPSAPADPHEGAEVLRREIVWFWHDLSHFITALGRGQLWWANGQLETLRLSCVNLARLKSNPSDPDVGEEGYYKVDEVLPAAVLAPLRDTMCPLEAEAMFEAASHLLAFYRHLAPRLAQANGLAYPTGLESLLLSRWDHLRQGLAG
jgi:lincosamide nucleotidyltransferase